MFESMEAARRGRTSSADFRLLPSAPQMKPTGAQKCANDVQTSLERAFPHCVRVFKARKKAPRNTTRRTKRRPKVTIAINGTANWCSIGPANILLRERLLQCYWRN